MKILLKILLAIVFVLWSVGAYLFLTDNPKSPKFIGFGVIILTLVLMPLFIYHRYNGKDLTKYSLKHNDPNASRIED
ncbi:hypothetical protein FHR24_000546 [Wenyingzhuangia heitensis]|uniref:Uncharacterized protein n=1 Tax=Wenyingzhuangia heitensis TaxID=1487859 RepID=A0ABX0U5H9_9FLAO|nr:hypothetical protein [Wenyingzhuangia heitensis]NIJ44107.1 hypothetical protein [Wenyingzhuangia heitensis]